MSATVWEVIYLFCLSAADRDWPVPYSSRIDGALLPMTPTDGLTP